MIGGKLLHAVVEQAVSGFDPSLIGPVSLDVRLGASGWVEDRNYWSSCRVVDVPSDQTLRKEPVSLEDGLHLAPGHLLLVETMEHFDMPLGFAGMFTLRSCYARNGLDQASSLVLRPGWRGKLLLELVNYTAGHTLVLTAGQPVGQIHFFSVEDAT